jgi:hypothetical protein
LYDLGIANIERLNIRFHAHSEQYWRGYADGLVTVSGAATAGQVLLRGVSISL